MKNIHILKTGKPSRLLKDIVDETYQFKKVELYGNRFELPLNIYITSNSEDINENDYIITKDNRLVQVSYLMSKDLEDASKVVLTDNQDLIKDGVQEIPDEFLEWFVENPRCEEVEVFKGFADGTDYGYNFLDYKIIIPKEEPKQDLEKEIFELEQELDIPSNLRFHNSKTQTEIDWSKFPKSTQEQVGYVENKQGTMPEAIKQVINEHLQKEPNQSAVEFLVEQLQSQSFIPKDSIVINHFIKVAVELENQQKDKYATDFLDSIREYERENGSRVCFDERDSKEFLEIYKIGKDEIK